MFSVSNKIKEHYRSNKYTILKCMRDNISQIENTYCRRRSDNYQSIIHNVNKTCTHRSFYSNYYQFSFNFAQIILKITLVAYSFGMYINSLKLRAYTYKVPLTPTRFVEAQSAKALHWRHNDPAVCTFAVPFVSVRGSVRVLGACAFAFPPFSTKYFSEKENEVTRSPWEKLFYGSD